MKYIGIDLGTTNSAICSYDGESVRLYKSPEQNDVTPSAIFIDRRGNKYLGKRAYDSAAKNPDNAATRFKRMMGTSTPITLSAANLTLTPEECSAEILKLCFGYLPEDIRNSGETGTVITVPAAFNQMQKDATLAAAEMAGLGQVALMQEPVAAVMCIMKHRKGDGVFLVFDLGGGTLDIAIAESTNGRVNLLSHGGVAMCGGTDFDRAILDNIVKPWLRTHFQLPEDFVAQAKYKSLLRMCLWAAEKAKIELSSRESAVISLTESDLYVRDESGNEIYVDITLTRQELDSLIGPKVEEAIASARDTLAKAGLSADDVERIVFVGGPTQYKPLRDRVAFELSIAPSSDVNPMTAVAEGAAVFAESIDWKSQNRGRKSSRGTLSAGGRLNLMFGFQARTPDTRAKIVALPGDDVLPGAEFQVDSLDTGWSSGRVALKDKATLEVTLTKPGENTFKIFVFDAEGGPILLAEDRIVITRTAAMIDAIPASHSIGVEAREKLGGHLVLDYLVREGDPLPKKGKKIFKTEESLKAGSGGSIKFKLWEGDITSPITDNRFIGMFEIKGSDFETGVIIAGSELHCEFEILDSGNIKMEVSVPSIGGAFTNHRNFYSRQDGQVDFSDATRLIQEEAAQARHRLDEMTAKVDDDRLAQARERLNKAAHDNGEPADPETSKQAIEHIQEAKRLLALTRKDHLKIMRQAELDGIIHHFEEMKELARPTEVSAFEALTRTAQRSIDTNGPDFETHLGELRSKCFFVLWRQDWFVIDRFKRLANSTHLFPDAQQHAGLCALGLEALNINDIEKLREIVWQLDMARIRSADDDDMNAATNIVRS